MSQPENELKSIEDKDLWSGITKGHLSRLVELAASDDPEQLSRYIGDMSEQYLWFGGLSTWIDGYNHWDTSDEAVAESYMDVLLSLAEAIGVLAVENPEQGKDGNWGRNREREPDEVAALVADTLGIDITPPEGVFAVAGVPYSGSALHYRHLNALYTAWRVRDLSVPGDAIAEYGGGLGLVALYLNRFRRRDTTLFDLPIVNLLSGYFLIGALGADAVCLEGEDQRPQAVKIRANWNCLTAADCGFHLSLNLDSFSEINARTVKSYISTVRRTTSSYFLSINHEVEHEISDGVYHLNIPRLLSDVEQLQRVYRMPYWLRTGYVEELYRVAT